MNFPVNTNKTHKTVVIMSKRPVSAPARRASELSVAELYDDYFIKRKERDESNKALRNAKRQLLDDK